VSTDAPSTFSIRDPLPTGTTLLEASAGTGKTWTIGALVTRYVAEGVATLEQMLVVTFGRAASQELRERVRTQLVEAEAALAEDPVPGSRADAPSDLIDLLLAGSVADVRLRHRRIRDALAGFDGATIATTHQFCSMVLDSLGVAGDTDAQATLVEDLEELMTEVVDDLYLRAFAYAEDRPAFTRAKALEIARAAVNDPQSRLEPADEEPTSIAGRKVAFARAVRAELQRRKRRLGILSYDDLLSRLADSLAERESPARMRMRQRWRIVLVDEFQDTDPVQWQVLDRAFSGHATMVLIGDPKQAIYAFRGGDVHTYLEAAASATTRQTLGVNWRSDAPLVAGLQRLIEGSALGHPKLVVHQVTARHDAGRLVGAPHEAPVRLRVVRRPGRGAMRMPIVRQQIATDLAADIRELLAAAPQFDGRMLEPRDIAVIAHRHSDLAAAKRALHRAGIPAVIAGGGSVFATAAALEWLTLLEALEQPQRVTRVRAAALTAFVGQTATGLDSGADALTDTLAEQLRAWAEVVRARGVAAVLEAANAHGLTARVLGLVDGERQLTDLRHIAEVLHEVALTQRLGVVALVGWLRDQITRARAGGGTERTRRLDSDAAAVQLVTIHASKGLEYPVVYLPSLADRHVRATPSVPLFHDEAGRRCRNVAESGLGWAEHVRAAKAEEAGESLRLLYVAMTRAQSQVVCWWAPSTNAPASPLHRLLLGRGPGESGVPDSTATPSEDRVVELFAAWRDAGGPAPELAVPAQAGEPQLPTDAGELRARRFTREVDADWRRTSYSSLTAHDRAASGGLVGSEPEVTPRSDEADGVIASASLDVSPAMDRPSPMSGLPVGATFGSLVHAVLEHTDPAAPAHAGDLAAELSGHLAEQLVYWPVPVDRRALVDALVAVHDTPLGPLADDVTLRGLALSDRLHEVDFELPLAGGDRRPGGGPTSARVPLLGDLAGVLRRHLPVGDPVLAYAESLDRPLLGAQRLLGYLTGSIDLVMRVGGRYLVVDYKTNWLGAVPEAGQEPQLTALDYRPDALRAAMGHSDYPLQALLYAVVLHRFLRWRLADYDPDTHLGGVLYLYLRGMCGPETPRVDGEPCGVFSWRPPAGLVLELSDLLDGRTP
jgi:exodeoxyribonuclease V beta subunit